MEGGKKRQDCRQVVRTGGTFQDSVPLEVERGEMEPEDLRQALDHVPHDRLRVELGGHRTAKIADRLLQPPTVGVHEAVDPPLHPEAQRFEQQEDAEREEDRKGPRRLRAAEPRANVFTSARATA